MNLSEKILQAIRKALDGQLKSIDIPGWRAELQEATLTEDDLKLLSEALQRAKSLEITISAEIALYLRRGDGSATALPSQHSYSARIKLSDGDCVYATVVAAKNWNTICAEGIDSLRKENIDTIHDIIFKIDPSLDESEPDYRTLMVLLASTAVGPHVVNLTIFTGYPKSFIQVISGRLCDAKIWDGDKVDCERWMDEKLASTRLLVDSLVAAGLVVRRWSDEESTYPYKALLPAEQVTQQLIF